MSSSRWKLEFDNGNWYVLYRGKAKAHFWDERLAKEYLKFKEGEVLSLPKVTKPRPPRKFKKHIHSCPTCGFEQECRDACGKHQKYRYCDQHSLLRKS